MRITTDQVYEGFYAAWREAEKAATESNKDIKEARDWWPSAGRIRDFTARNTKRHVSKPSVQHHLSKLLIEGMVRREFIGREGVYYPVGLFLTELDRAMAST